MMREPDMPIADPRDDSVVNLNARRQREKTRSKVDYEDFFENGCMALHIVGPDGVILRANQAELDLLGYEADEYIGHHIVDFYVDRTVIEDILARLRSGENVTRYPARMRARDGSVRHVEVSSSVQFVDGEFINTRCFTADVTDLQRAREELSQRDHRFHQILDGLPVAVYTTDAAGKITYYNRAAAELAGREPKVGEDDGA